VTRELVVADLRRQIPRLAGVPAAERAGFRGISRPRARQVVAGALAAEVTLSALDVASVEVCPWALREGILLRHLERVADTPALPLQPLTRHPDATVRQLRPAEEQPLPS
jgi:exopolyphosphatase/guanosine-5'-triphosphate,3'-diphosphate pyrophosphatase